LGVIFDALQHENIFGATANTFKSSSLRDSVQEIVCDNHLSLHFHSSSHPQKKFTKEHIAPQNDNCKGIKCLTSIDLALAASMRAPDPTALVSLSFNTAKGRFTSAPCASNILKCQMFTLIRIKKTRGIIETYEIMGRLVLKAATMRGVRPREQ